MATRPRTIGYALLDSPVALAAWMIDHDTDAYYKIARAFIDEHPRATSAYAALIKAYPIGGTKLAGIVGVMGSTNGATVGLFKGADADELMITWVGATASVHRAYVVFQANRKHGITLIRFTRGS